jgi:hypothetical protein
MTVYNDKKLCEDECPQCGSKDIKWGHLEPDDPPYQKADCKVCGCEFKEVLKYEYACTVYDDKPVREFYPDEKCPDCGEDINKAAEPGDECHNCDHVFNYPKKDDG